MKTQIFQLDRYDDILSARDQIGWSKAARICIVLPAVKRLHFSPVDYVVLAREASRIGAQAAFIVQDGHVRLSLEQLGLLCFGSLRQANRANWRTSRRMKIPDADTLQKERRRHGRPEKPVSAPVPGGKIARRVQAGFFSAALFAMAVLGSMFLPQAQISVARSPADQVYQFSLRGDALHDTAPLSGVIHAERLDFSFTEEITVQATGTGTFGDGVATGEVMLQNLTGRDLVIPPGVTLQTGGDEPVQFRITQPVTLPAQPSEPQSAGIQAVLPGPAGNVPAGSIRQIFGELGLSVRVENLQPTGGGTEIRVSTLSAGDVGLARETLLTEMDSRAAGQAAGQAGDGQLVIASSIRRDETLLEDVSTPIGMPCQEAVLTIQASYTAWVVAEEDLSQISTALLDTLLPENMRAVDRTLQFRLIDPYREEQNGFSQAVELTRRVEHAIASEDIITALSGQKRSQISGILREQFGDDPAIHVSLSPAWWPVMPAFNFQYQIIEP